MAVSGTTRSRLLPMSSSKALASASVFVDLGVDDGDGSREQADIRGTVVPHASAAMTSRRVNKKSDNGRLRVIGQVRTRP